MLSSCRASRSLWMAILVFAAMAHAFGTAEASGVSASKSSADKHVTRRTKGRKLSHKLKLCTKAKGHHSAHKNPARPKSSRKSAAKNPRCIVQRRAPKGLHKPVLAPGAVLVPRVPASDAPVGGLSSPNAPLLQSIAAPAIPVSQALPTIAGKPATGQSLAASTGSWTGAPNSFGYQWQACNPSSEICADLQGATNTSYTPNADDVGHALRVVVTAANEGGAASTASVMTAVVTAPLPKASFTVEPTSPSTGQRVVFDGSSSTCADVPCTYEWSDDGGLTRPLPAVWPLGGGELLQYTFSTANTKYVRLVVTDASGQTATVEHNVVVVTSASPPPPMSPKNAVAPSVSGAAQVGQRLTASSGSWSGSTPLNYSYQWQDCNASGESCTDVKGATSATYSVAEGDVGHTMRILVTVANGAGSTSLASTHTSVVVAAPAETAPAECTTTVTPAMSASAIAGAIVSANDGGTVCLAGGSYPFIHVVGAVHKAYVTVRPVAGATATVEGMEVANSSFLRFEGLRMTEGFNAR